MSARPKRNQTTMAIKADKARAPRGAKNVAQAFFAALDAVPDSQRAAIATAALTAIRDEVKARRLKAKGKRGGADTLRNAGKMRSPVVLGRGRQDAGRGVGV
jgi:phage tail tape-measure protein